MDRGGGADRDESGRRPAAGPTALYVAGWFIVLELISNLVLETVFYAGAAGVTQVSLIISLAFWTWLGAQSA